MCVRWGLAKPVPGWGYLGVTPGGCARVGVALARLFGGGVACYTTGEGLAVCVRACLAKVRMWLS